MRVAHDAHLTYCTNIHPGEDLAALRSALELHVTRVKEARSPDAPFGVGLRVSNRASLELAQGHALAELRAWLDAQGLYVFTLNGFPYGTFHAASVKERVYEPDWRSRERVAYTDRLADQLAVMLPEGLEGSVSTVPCAWKLALHDETEVASMAANLLDHAAHLHELREARGVTIALALEPEPGCYLETIDESVRFFAEHLMSERAQRAFAERTGVAMGSASEALRRHLGLCVDTCHAAVEFEEPSQIWTQLERAGIDVKKLQLSAGLRVPRVDANAIHALRAFSDDVYLHQTVQRSDGSLDRFADLPDALRMLEKAEHAAAAREWRIHFHVPVFLQSFGVLESTRAFLVEVLQRQRSTPISKHLEVETYTWDVLPAELRRGDVVEAIVRELDFVERVLQGERPT